MSRQCVHTIYSCVICCYCTLSATPKQGFSPSYSTIGKQTLSHLRTPASVIIGGSYEVHTHDSHTATSLAQRCLDAVPTCAVCVPCDSGSRLMMYGGDASNSKIELKRYQPPGDEARLCSRHPTNLTLKALSNSHKGAPTQPHSQLHPVEVQQLAPHRSLGAQ